MSQAMLEEVIVTARKKVENLQDTPVSVTAFNEDALAQPHAREMDFTGRPLKGMIYVAPAGFKTKRALTSWVDRAVACAWVAAARSLRACALSLSPCW